MTGFLVGFFWGVFWFLIGGGLIGLLLTLWVIFRVVVWADTQPDDIEDVPPMLLECPRCGHRCETCFKGVPEETATMWHCNECGWIGPRAK